MDRAAAPHEITRRDRKDLVGPIANPTIGEDSGVMQREPQRVVPKSWRSRMLDGEHAWGALEVGPGRSGFRRFRLIVLPPGISTVERRYVRLARSWPTWGAVLWLLVATALSANQRPPIACAYAAAVTVAAGAFAYAMAGNARSRVRTLQAIVIDGYHDPTTAARYAQLSQSAETLLKADASLELGEISIADHEFIWWQVYESLTEAQV